MSLVMQPESPWLVHYSAGVPAQLEYPPQLLWWFLEQAAAKFGTRIACRYGHQELSYAELWEAVRRVAAGLAARGLKPGDRVGILLPNCPEYLISVYGVWLAGGVVVSLSPFMVADEVSSLLDLTDCQSLIAIDLLAPLCRHATAPQHTFLVSLEDRLPYWERLGYRVKRVQRGGRGSRGGAGCSRFAELLNGEALPLPIEHEPIDVPAYVLCTGGTTGAPKAVVLTHRNLVANAWQIAHWVGRRTGQETILAVIPFFHSYGLTTCVVGGVAMAATLILDHRFQPRRVVELVEQHRPTLFYAVPTMLAMLNKHLREHPADVRSLKWCVSGGSALDPPIAEEFAKHSGALVIEGYGLSEAGPVTHVNPLDETARRGWIGLPLPDTEARIADMKTGEGSLPPGEVGELLVRGPQVMAGYWNNPAETAQVLRDGWLHTGDLATHDEDGFFRIVGRKKELIITSGFNVYPADVEHVLRQCPGVAEAAVVGVPHPERGEVVKAYLVLQKGRRFRRSEFDRFARAHLSKYKRPQWVEIVDDLPRNFLGKVLHRQLKTGNRIGKAAAERTAMADGPREISRQPLAVLAGVRTPFVKAFGELAALPADELGRIAVERLLARSGCQPGEVDEVIFGNVAGPPEASNIARVIALRARVPADRIAHTVNRNCASGMEAIFAAWQAIEEDRAELVIVGGTESMSNVPLIWDRRMKDWFVRWRRERRWWRKAALLAQLRPSFFRPVAALELGLTDPTCGLTMGQTAEVLAREFSISRERQDEFALTSHQRAVAAWEQGFFDGEVLPLGVEETGGAGVQRDSGPRPGQTMAALAKLAPIFERNGTITVGNSCPITDGAVALLAAPLQHAVEPPLEPLGYVRAYAVAGCDPRRMGLGPVFAIHKLLWQTGRSLADFDLLEINEAFAAQVLACLKAMASEQFAREHLGRQQALGEIDPSRLNVHGGAIALGHPVGATGARLVLTLLRALRARGGRNGLASLCVGGGQGVAVWVQTTLEEE